MEKYIILNIAVCACQSQLPRILSSFEWVDQSMLRVYGKITESRRMRKWDCPLLIPFLQLHNQNLHASIFRQVSDTLPFPVSLSLDTESTGNTQHRSIDLTANELLA